MQSAVSGMHVCVRAHAEIDGKLQPNPLVRDDQALVMNVKGRGLVIISGCAHAGIINTVLYAEESAKVNNVCMHA